MRLRGLLNVFVKVLLPNFHPSHEIICKNNSFEGVILYIGRSE